MKVSVLALACAAAAILVLGAASTGWTAGASEVASTLSTRQVGYEIYQVCPGDTIDNVAARYGVTPESIRNVNGLGSSSELAPGQSLAIVMPNRPRIFVPKQAEAPSAEDAEAIDDSGDGPLAVRYGVTTQDCAITTAIPPAQGRTLYQCDKGTRLVISARQGDYYGIVMADGSTGWAPSSALELTEDMISADELTRMLQGGTGGGSPEVVQEAYRYLGVPYKYGGSLPNNLDCSLLVQTAFAAKGIHLPRTAAQQAGVGRYVNGADLQPGDRLYFINRTGRIGHTAIYVGSGQFIHASARRGCVAVDSFADSYYRSHFYGARR